MSRKDTVPIPLQQREIAAQKTSDAAAAILAEERGAADSKVARLKALRLAQGTGPSRKAGEPGE